MQYHSDSGFTKVARGALSQRQAIEIHRACLNMPKRGQQQQSLGSGSAVNTRQQFLLPVVAYFCAFFFLLHFFIEGATAEPVLASSLGFCKNVTVLEGPPLHCCLPQPKRSPIRFRFPRLSRGRNGKPILRERKPAHILQRDPEYVKKYNLAYARMKALPASDPRSFLNQEIQ